MIAKDSEVGFTLIELMISLALFGLIAIAGLALVEGVLGIEQRTGGRLDRLAELQRAIYVVTLDLEQVADGDVSGTADALSFSRRAAALGGIPVPVSYTLAGGALDRNLGGPSGGGAQRLLTGVSEVRWRFYEPERGWLDRWPPSSEQAEVWPAAVAAEMVLTSGGTGPSGVVRRVVALPARP